MTNSIQKKLSLFTLIFIVVVIGLGAFTRLTEAGLGCPDWPGCYGHVGIPLKEATIEKANQAFPDTPYELSKAWPEMVHRYFAGTLGLLILALFIIALNRRSEPNNPLKLTGAILLVVIFQAALGAWTVTMKLHPIVVVSHLLGGFTTFSLLTVLAIRLYQPARDFTYAQVSSIQKWVTLAIVLVVFQIFLGGKTSAHYAATICIDLPICHVDGWYEKANFVEGFRLWGYNAETYQYGILSGEGRIALHVSHRIGAIVVLCMVGFLLWNLIRIESKTCRHFAYAIGALLVLQICLGVINVTFGLPLFNAVAHNLVGALLLVSLIACRSFIWLQKKHEASNV
ncbi:MAG: COX15/CtaA family protein [Gammaproteobacteria bacterium]|nr:COX15/CtaA family protein [Gammaproteobacteria bacterium]